jgi:hypothetical protein
VAELPGIFDGRSEAEKMGTNLPADLPIEIRHHPGASSWDLMRCKVVATKLLKYRLLLGFPGEGLGSEMVVTFSWWMVG